MSDGFTLCNVPGYRRGLFSHITNQLTHVPVYSRYSIRVLAPLFCVVVCQIRFPHCRQSPGAKALITFKWRFRKTMRDAFVAAIPGLPRYGIRGKRYNRVGLSPPGTPVDIGHATTTQHIHLPILYVLCLCSGLHLLAFNTSRVDHKALNDLPDFFHEGTESFKQIERRGKGELILVINVRQEKGRRRKSSHLNQKHRQLPSRCVRNSICLGPGFAPPRYLI